MRSWRCVFGCVALVMPVAIIHPVLAQEFPSRTVRIVTGEAGGSNDIVSRMVAQGLTASFSQSVIVENRGGVVGILARIVARSVPDGHTLFVVTGSFWVNPMLEDNAGYDPVRDFTPVAMLTQTPTVLVANPLVAAKTVSELVALARAKPGVLNYGSGPTGGTGHLGAALFNSMAGVNITLIPYKGGAPALNDLLGGRVQLMFATGALLGSHLQSGKLRALAVGSAKPSALFPGLPTIAASGVPGYEFVTTQCLFAPARTPQPVINRIGREVAGIFGRPDVRDKFASMGTEPGAHTRVSGRVHEGRHGKNRQADRRYRYARRTVVTKGGSIASAKRISPHTDSVMN
jgi:tripartite-type tricarboxylate transporter receptor subunit TctC